VINKVDRRDARPERVLNDTFDLFVELGATDEQAEFPVLYAVATDGRVGETPALGPDVGPLFRAILRHVPAPRVELEAPAQLLVTTLGYDQYRGMTAVGRLFAGKLSLGQPLARITRTGEILTERAQYLFLHEGLNRVEVEEAHAGEIVAIAGLEGVGIGETLTDPDNPVPLPVIEVEAPTVRMSFSVNDSPFAGREGDYVTSRQLRKRLLEELKHNVALRVTETESADTFTVSGRGELHLAILIETMRREGYEFQVSRPEVIFREGPDGALLEPYEEVHVDTSPDTVGVVVEMLGKRRGEMVNMQDAPGGNVHLTYVVPTRGLLGFRYQFLTATRGEGIMHTLFHDYNPLAGEIGGRPRGSLVAWETGVSNTYGLKNAEPRGTLFVAPGVEVYQGMVVGEHQRPGDLDVNICKQKHLTNMRNSIRDIDVRLTPPRQMSLDECIEYLGGDELLEVTPASLRIRKRVLDKNVRERDAKRSRQALAA
jgi:GTP-binding protein